MKVMAFLLIVSQCRYKRTFIILKRKFNQNEIGVNASDDNPSSLVELVNVIDSIFSSVKRTSITKEELLQKIMINCLDFVEISMF
jgi:hypothetical protein